MDQRLQQALRTLRAIRQRYEAGRNTGSGYVRACTVQVALGYADMLWITAAIDALEKAAAPSPSEGLEMVQHASTHTTLTTTLATISHSTQPPAAV